jgi:putative nucleotidyltransferase with HDIG domain
MTQTKNTDTQPLRAEIEGRIRALPRLPSLCQGLLAKLTDPTLDFGTLAEDVKFDPGMTANVLKLANSAYFGAPREIGSVKEAFVRIGLRRLFEVVIGAGVGPLLSDALSGYELRRHELLQHSAWTAALAGELASELGLATPDMLFTAGLVHDVGKIVLDPFVHAHRAKLEAAMSGAPPLRSFEQAEQAVFGMDHAEVGAAILEQWKFPAALVAAVAHHHNPERVAAEHRIAANLVHVANTLAGMSGVGSGIAGMRHTVSTEAVQALGLRTSVLERVAGHTFDTMHEMERLLS